MKILYDKRCSGKTTKLIAQILLEPKSILIVGNEERKNQIIDMCRMIENRVYSLYDLNKGDMQGRDIDGAYIDDLECLISSLVGVTVKGFSISNNTLSVEDLPKYKIK